MTTLKLWRLSMNYRRFERYWNNCYAVLDGTPVFFRRIDEDGRGYWCTTQSIKGEDRRLIETIDESKITDRTLNGFYVVGTKSLLASTMTMRQWKKGVFLGGDGRSTNTRLYRINYNDYSSVDLDINTYTQMVNNKRPVFCNVDTFKKAKNSVKFYSERELITVRLDGSALYHHTLYGNTSYHAFEELPEELKQYWEAVCT